MRWRGARSRTSTVPSGSACSMRPVPREILARDRRPPRGDPLPGRAPGHTVPGGRRPPDSFPRTTLGRDRLGRHRPGCEGLEDPDRGVRRNLSGVEAGGPRAADPRPRSRRADPAVREAATRGLMREPAFSRERMVLSAVDTVPATVFLAVCLSVFGRKMYLRLRYLFLAKGRERRWDHIPTRIMNFVVYGIFQRKVAREWYAGVLHSFIFWAFVILGASVVEITAQAYAPGWRVPTPTIAVFSLSGPLYLAEEGIAALAVIGVGMALYRRYVIRPKKLMHEGMRDATIVLCFILGIVTSFLLFNAADAAAATVALPEWKPISSAIASTSIFSADPALWWHALWWTHVVLLFSFL